MNNIKSIGIDCASCGACSVVCPKACISFGLDDNKGYYAVSVDENACIDCGKCKEVCPVINSEAGSKHDSALGDTINAYATYSNNEEVRKYAASGGFITSFLCYMLNEGLADGVLISKRDGVSGKSFIARTEEEVINSKTSIYAPVDYSSGIKELVETECQNVIVVGLPCQIQSVSNLEVMNRRIREKVLLKISIICGKTPSVFAYKYIAEKGAFDFNTISKVCNRGDGWPGFLKIDHSKGQFKVPYHSSLSMGMVLSSPYLCNRGCLSCVDGVGLTADFVVCDAWMKKYTSQESDGWNFVLTKTGRAENLMNSEAINKYIYREKEEVTSFFRANKRVIEKGILGNAMRLKEHRFQSIFDTLPVKYRMHVVLLQLTLKYFNPKHITKNQLIIGKIINKLKD